MAKPAPIDAKAWLQELRTNRQTQAALLGFAAFLTWVLWPEPPKKTRRAPAGPAQASARMDPQQLAQVRKLPDLAKLDRTGELPGDTKMGRDLFVFDGPAPPPPPPKPVKPPPPPPPPTEQELAAQRLQAERNGELNQKPSTLRYLGLIESPSAGQIGAFMKGELPVQYKKGELVGTRWQLASLTDKKVVFQNTKFTDLTFTLEARDGSGPAQQQTVTNEF